MRMMTRVREATRRGKAIDKRRKKELRRELDRMLWPGSVKRRNRTGFQTDLWVISPKQADFQV